MTAESPDPFDTVYSPRRIEFWLAHWEELATMVQTPKSSAHIAEHLAHEWMHLQVRMRYCLCHEQHAIDSMAVDPACTHEASGGRFKRGPETALCVYADLHKASAELPAHWLATRRIWQEQGVSSQAIELRRKATRFLPREPEPIFARSFAIERMAKSLGWTKHEAAA